MKFLISLLLLSGGCAVGVSSDPAPVHVVDQDDAGPGPDICDLNVLAPRQIGGLGARSDTIHTLAIYQYVDKTDCAPWYYQCGDNLMVITCPKRTERWSLDGVSLVSGYHATLQIYEDGQLVSTEKLALGPTEKDAPQP
jgi:hypothetical protein